MSEPTSQPAPSPPENASAEEVAKSPSLWTRLGSALGPFLALGIVFLFFAVADSAANGNGAFLKDRNIRSIAVDLAPIAVGALGMTLIIIAGGIDLSAGTAITLCATVLAWSLLEDVAVLWTHGDNVHRAQQRFKEAQDGHDVFADEVQSDRDALARSEGRLAQAKTTLNVWQQFEQTAQQKWSGLLSVLDLWSADGSGFEMKTIWQNQIQTEIQQVQRSIARAEESLIEEQEALDKKTPELEELEEILDDENEKLATVLKISETRSRWTPWIAIPLTILVGCLAGWLNGVLISYLRVVPFIVTLGTMQIFLGSAKQLANQTTVRPDAETQVPDWLGELLSIRSKALYPKWESGHAGLDKIIDYIRFPLGIWVLLLLSIALWAVLKYTVFGRYVFALGSNEATVRLCGINVTRNKILVYMLGGLFLGIAGIYHFSLLAVGDPTSGTGLELEIIAAVVIGGGSLNGGRGSVVGTLCGAAIMAVIISGCTQLGLKNPVQNIILGVIVIAAVTLDQVRTRRQST